jgi:hypothetical protein
LTAAVQKNVTIIQKPEIKVKILEQKPAAKPDSKQEKAVKHI